MQAVEGVDDVHHVHIWNIDEPAKQALEAHVVVSNDTMVVIDGIKNRVKARFARRLRHPSHNPGDGM